MASPGSSSGFRQSFEAFWSKFRKTFYFRLLLLVLVSVLAVLLLQSPIVCLSLILIPLMILLVPHWFGERSVKNHAINGVIVFVLGALLYAAILTPSIMSLPQQAQSETMDPTGSIPARAILSEGIVTPFQGSEGTSFNFTVKMQSADTNRTQFDPRVQVLSVDGFTVFTQFFPMENDTGRPGNLSSGAYYYVNTTLPPQVHLFNFEVFPNRTATDPASVLVGTRGSYGPYNVGVGPHFVFLLYRGVFQFGFLVFGFFLILLIYWWTRKAREIRGTQQQKAEAKRAEGGGEFTCTNCGADVSEDATKCPTCGAVFESEAEGESAKPIQPT